MKLELTEQEAQDLRKHLLGESIGHAWSTHLYCVLVARLDALLLPILARGLRDVGGDDRGRKRRGMRGSSDEENQ